MGPPWQLSACGSKSTDTPLALAASAYASSAGGDAGSAHSARIADMLQFPLPVLTSAFTPSAASAGKKLRARGGKMRDERARVGNVEPTKGDHASHRQLLSAAYHMLVTFWEVHHVAAVAWVSINNSVERTAI